MRRKPIFAQKIRWGRVLNFKQVLCTFPWTSLRWGFVFLTQWLHFFGVNLRSAFIRGIQSEIEFHFKFLHAFPLWFSCLQIKCNFKCSCNSECKIQQTGFHPDLIAACVGFYTVEHCWYVVCLLKWGPVPTDAEGWAELIEINHDDKFVTTERFEISQHMERLTLGSMTPKRREVERRLTSPIINTCLDTKNIAFER